MTVSLPLGNIDENAFYLTTGDNSTDIVNGALVYAHIVKGKLIDSTIWCSVCYGNGVFVAVDNDAWFGAAYSVDGVVSLA